MAKRTKPADYQEPWTAMQSHCVPKDPFPGGEIPHYIPIDDASQMIVAYEKSLEDTEWLIWGSRMSPTGGYCKDFFTGEYTRWSDQGIVAKFDIPRTCGGGKLHSRLCQRAVECVNACAGIADPVATLNEVRAFLASITLHDPEASAKAVALLGRMLPLEIKEESESESGY